MSAVDLVELTIAGTAYRGWTSVEIARGIDALAASFTLGLTERWPGQPTRQEIRGGDACTVSIDGETVVTGYVDSADASLAGTSHSITVSGRSKAGDLVDCSAIATPGSWTNRTMEAIAGELTAPFGISVIARTDTGAPFAKFALQPGEDVHAAIDRMAKMRGLLVVSTATGDLEIATPAVHGDAVRIVEGRQPLSLAVSHRVDERFSRYIVKGQAAGTDARNGKAASQPSAEASDPGVARYRPLLVTAEDQADIATMRTRAAWEASVRAAKAQEAHVELIGWRRPDGALWAAMDAVTLTAPSLWIDATLIVADVRYSVDERGRRVALKLARPEAYSPKPVPKGAEAGRLAA